MKKSDSISELAKALSKAQSSYNSLIKDSNNPFFKSKYADLAACIECIRTPLVDNGLSIIQSTDIDDGVTVVETILLHTSGEWISGRYPLTPVKSDPQGLGAALTYARRYALTSLLGIAAEDDDGESAMGRGTTSQKRESHNTPPPSAKREEPTYSKSSYSDSTIAKVKKLEKDGMKGKECLQHFIPEYNAEKGTTFKNVADFEEDKLLNLISYIENKPPKGM